MSIAEPPQTIVGGALVRARNARRILDAARSMVEEGGLEELSMRRLALAADVSVRTIYNLFGDKRGLVTALVRESFDATALAVRDIEATDPIERIWEAVAISIEANCRFVPKAVVAAIAADETLQVELAGQWPGLEPTLEAIRSAASSGALRHDLPPEVLFEQAGTVFLHLLSRWAQGWIDDETLRANVLRAFDIALLAVATPNARARLLAHALEHTPPHSGAARSNPNGTKH